MTAHPGNLAGRPPLGQKEPPPIRSVAYCNAVRKERCIICEAFGEIQLSRTTFHHVICKRHSQVKTCDTRGIPLCDGHHQGNFDKSKIAIHREPDAWRAKYGLDTDYTDIIRDRLAKIYDRVVANHHRKLARKR